MVNSISAGVNSKSATFVQQGQMMMKTKLGEDVMQQIAEQAMMKHTKLEVGMEFLPKTGPEITWDPGEMNIKYEMEKLNIDWPSFREISISAVPRAYSSLALVVFISIWIGTVVISIN